MEPPLELPAVQEGPSDPPKLTFGAKMHGTAATATFFVSAEARAGG